MTRFLLGFAMPCAVAMGWALADALLRRPFLGGPPAPGAIVTMAIVPVLAAWAAMELPAAVRPRRLFDRRRPRPWRAALLGAATGTVSLVAMTVAIAFLDEVVAQALLAAGCAFVVTSAVGWCLPVVRRHACPVCGYDLRGVLGSDRCPECGVRGAELAGLC